MGNIYSTVPYNAQLNKISVALNCSTPGLQSNPTLEFSTTAPLSGGSGQQVFFSDIAGALILTDAFQSLAEGYDSWNVDIDVELLTTNAAPQGLVIEQSVTNPVSESRFSFSTNGTDLPLGPITLGSLAESDLTIGQVSFVLTLYNSDGSTGDQTSNICTPDQPAKVISSIAVDSSSGDPVAPSNGNSSNFPVVPLGSKYTNANVPTSCVVYLEDAKLGVPYAGFNFSISATSPVSVTAGSSFNLTDVIAFLTIPPNITYGLDSPLEGSPDPADIQLVLGQFYGVKPPTTGLGLTVANATPATFDLARTDPRSETSQAYLLRTDRLVSANASVALSMPLPLTGSLSAGPFTAGSSGDIISVSVNKLGGYLLSNNGGSASVSCTFGTAVELFSIPVA